MSLSSSTRKFRSNETLIKQMKQVYKHSKYLLLSLIALFVLGCEDDNRYEVQTGTRSASNGLQLLDQLNNYEYFQEALVLTGLNETVSAQAGITVFAPTDAAFEAFMATLGVENVSDIPVDYLTQVLRYHIVSGEFPVGALTEEIPTLADSKPIYTFTTDAGVVLNGKSVIVQPGRMASNAIIHGVSFVLTPPTGNLLTELNVLTNDNVEGAFTLLEYALEMSGVGAELANADADFTLLAPTDAAFVEAGITSTDDIDALGVEAVRELLSYHILAGVTFSQQFVAGRTYTFAGAEGVAQGLDVSVDGNVINFSGTSTTTPNIAATNGVIHVVNSLVQPYPYLAERLFNGNPGLISYYATNSFYRGIVQAGLVDKFSTEERFHVLSPSNYAVRALLLSLGVTSWAGLTPEQAQMIVNRHTFDPELSITGATGDRIVNSLGEAYFVTENGDGITINGELGEANELIASEAMYINGFGYFANPFTDASAGIYNGTITSITKTLDRIGALPEEVLAAEMAENPETTLFAAALMKTELLSATGIYTVFALDNAAFTAATGLETVEEIQALDPATDATFLAALEEFLLAQVTEGLYFSLDASIDYPEFTTSEGTLQFISQADELKIQDGTIQNVTFVEFLDVDNVAFNGVYHVVNRPFVY